jgi:hypothetical protein
VRPSGAGADEGYYLRAELDTGQLEGFGAVSWFETAGVSCTINNMVSQLYIYEGQACIARNGAGITTIFPGSGENVSFTARKVGDGLTSPVPWFSDELDNWLIGAPLQIAAVTAPNLLMFRTRGWSSQLYLYRYEDNKNNGQRVLEAWSKFQYHPSLGNIVGVSSFKKSGLIFTARATGIVADVIDFKPGLDSHGYIDSRIPYADRADNGVADGSVVVNSTSPYFLLGTPLSRIDEFLGQFDDLDEEALEFGVVSPASVTPSNPFPRDQNGQAVLDGRMALNRVSADVRDTAGLVAVVTTRNRVQSSLDFEGRILGDSDNLIGRQPIYNGQLSIPVGREVRECQYTLSSKDWLPMRITGLSWVGQTFNNVRRVS